MACSLSVSPSLFSLSTTHTLSLSLCVHAGDTNTGLVPQGCFRGIDMLGDSVASPLASISLAECKSYCTFDSECVFAVFALNPATGRRVPGIHGSGSEGEGPGLRVQGSGSRGRGRGVECVFKGSTLKHSLSHVHLHHAMPSSPHHRAGTSASCALPRSRGRRARTSKTPSPPFASRGPKPASKGRRSSCTVRHLRGGGGRGGTGF
jgi:hypothetical protein